MHHRLHERPTADLKDQLQHTLGDGYIIERELGGGGMSRQLLETAAPASAASTKVDPWYESLRQDPRFQGLVAGR